MSTLDHDKDGRISYDEFQEGFKVSGVSSFSVHTFALCVWGGGGGGGYLTDGYLPVCTENTLRQCFPSLTLYCVPYTQLPTCVVIVGIE